ncbi:hypothetical protein EW145_g6421 [Phellinidium pouzarii]|uniref:Oxidase ustYa n=1 Tax=Phellinidium pouzarii TaxID=167371 RepID=A0A4S4KWM1_9AGAM|nr:hypothetical protein EW145_g6421 [Phellinidium pouzarii]
MKPSLRPLLSSLAVLLTLSLINLVIVVKRLAVFRDLQKTDTYSYVGNDFPELLPLDRPLTLVDRTFTNSTADYPIHGPDAEPAWNRVYPDGFGFVRLGTERRILCVSMFHQLHCVEKMRRALDNPDDPLATLPHLQHCMNYIRQMILCGSDLTLEPEEYNPVTRRKEATGVGVTHTCRDSSVAYDTINDNYARWTEYWEEVKETVPVPR